MASARRTAVLVLVGLLALTGCKSKTSSASPTPTAHPITASNPAVGASGTPTAGGSTGTCPTSATPGVIGGVNKCLRVGQLCSHKHSSDYPQYGFSCEQSGSRYVLRKKS